MASLFRRFRNFDIYTFNKPIEDYRVKTSFGGIVTLVSLSLIVLLFIAELTSYLSIEVTEMLFVDSTSAEQRVDINFDIAFHKLSCDLISVDVMSLSGENQDSIEDDIFKQRLDSTGAEILESKPEKQSVNVNATKTTETANKTKDYCGSCYGAILGCCNTCEEVKDAYRYRGWEIENLAEIEQCKNDFWVNKILETKGQGCRVFGKVEVGKVGGNFHIAPGTSTTHEREHYHNFHSLSPSRFDTSHTINHFSFGKPYPGKTFPLDKKISHSDKAAIMFQYNLKIVTTSYLYRVSHPDEGSKISYQFAVTKLIKDISSGASGIPGVFFQYEFSPLMVQYEEKQRPLSDFLVSLCVIIGGVFTVAGLVDSFIYRSAKIFKEKLQLGKFN